MAEASTSKQHLMYAALVVTAGLVVLYLLWKSGQGGSSVASGTITPAVGPQPQSYPNSQPINLGDVSIVEGSSPQSAYNVVGDIPTIAAADPWGSGGACDGCKDDCDQVGTTVTTQKIDPALNDANVQNILSFKQKVTSGVDHARVTFGSVGSPAPSAAKSTVTMG